MPNNGTIPLQYGLANSRGTLAMARDPSDPTGQTLAAFDRNPDFGRAFSTFSQEGVDSRRTTRLRLRITF